MGEITRERIDELLRFLPQFEHPGPELAATWSSLDPDPVTGDIQWPHPIYPAAVDHFFSLAAQPWWRYVGTNSEEAAERIRDDAAIALASLDQIKEMLTCCVQLERFIDGLQDSMIRGGRIGAILRRLAVLREELPLEARKITSESVAMLSASDRFRGCLLGLAVGDAVGTTVEFRERGTFDPLTDMIGGGPFGLVAGQWTDDTSMALCLATSLIERQGFDAHDQMTRYCQWMDTGYLSSNGRCFDIGGTVRAALRAFQRNGSPFAGSTDPQAAGNGCIMRLAPIPMFYFPDLDAVERYSGESSRTTQGAAECIDASRLFGRIVCRALLGQSKHEVLLGDADSFSSGDSIAAIARGDYREKSVDDIVGSGYVVNSLEAALWAFADTDNFAEAILAAANLGDDADTTAAVCGQVAGAFYGESGIPAHWLGRLTMRAEIAKLADQLGQIQRRLSNAPSRPTPTATPGEVE